MQNNLSIPSNSGDYEGDITLLEAADTGVAASNAQEEVKRVANMTVKLCNEFAIADLIEFSDKKDKL